MQPIHLTTLTLATLSTLTTANPIIEIKATNTKSSHPTGTIHHQHPSATSVPNASFKINENSPGCQILISGLESCTSITTNLSNTTSCKDLKQKKHSSSILQHVSDVTGCQGEGTGFKGVKVELRNEVEKGIMRFWIGGLGMGRGEGDGVEREREKRYQTEVKECECVMKSSEVECKDVKCWERSVGVGVSRGGVVPDRF